MTLKLVMTDHLIERGNTKMQSASKIELFVVFFLPLSFWSLESIWIQLMDTMCRIDIFLLVETRSCIFEWFSHSLSALCLFCFCPQLLLLGFIKHWTPTSALYGWHHLTSYQATNYMAEFYTLSSHLFCCCCFFFLLLIYLHPVATWLQCDSIF